MARRFFVLVTVLGIFFVTLWVLPTEVRAALKSVSPADTAILDRQPSPVVLIFTTALVPSASVGKVVDTGGNVISTGSVIGSSDRTRLKISLRANLLNGTYTVTYHAIVANDGRVMNGATGFTVDIPENIAATSTAAFNTTVAVYGAGNQTGATSATAIVAPIAPTPAFPSATQTVAARTAVAAVSGTTNGTPPGVAAAPTRVGADRTQTVAARTAEAGLGTAVAPTVSGTPLPPSRSARTMLPNTGKPSGRFPVALIVAAFVTFVIGLMLRVRHRS